MKQRLKHMKRWTVGMSVLVFIILSGITALLVNHGYVQAIRRLVRSTTTSNIRELTASRTQYMDERLRSELLALQSLASVIGEQEDIFSGAALAEEYKVRQGATCVWICKDLDTVWNTRRERELTPDQKQLFEGAMQDGEGIACVFKGEMGRRKLLIQTPIYKSGEIAGVLFVSYPVESLQNTYSGATYNDVGYSYVLDADGSIVLDPVRFSYLQMYDNFQDVLISGNNNPEAIGRFMAALRTGAKGTATFDFEGEKQFLSFTPLREKDGWYFVSVIPLDMVEKDGKAIVELAAKMALVIIFATVFLILLILSMIYYRNKKIREYDQYIRSTYEAISQNMDTVIFIVDGRTGKVEYAFENAKKVLGIPAEAFSGMGREHLGEFGKKLAAFLQEKPEQKSQWELLLFHDGLDRQMWLKVISLPVILMGNQKYIFSVDDITEDKQIQENLNAAVAAAEQANNAKSRFLSNMSHDIRTPMNAIVGMTRLAELSVGDEERVKDCLKKIDISSKHLLSLINDVLDMSKIESGKMTLSTKPFALSELFEGSYAIVQSQCRAKEQTFRVERKNIRHEYLEGDTLRLNQVFLNLASNAVKFTPEQGSITFVIEELPQKHPGCAAYRFQISDTGIGISTEFLPHIFNTFEREMSDNVGQTEGTGLGLAIARSIVEAMGGQISVESEVGKGTTFTVELELPLRSGDSLDSAKETSGKYKGDFRDALSGLRFLLVEDNLLNQEIACEFLKAAGARVECAANGRDGVNAFEETEEGYYDGIFMDIQMPVMNGYEAAAAIRSLHHPQAESIPIIAMSANMFTEDVQAALKAGMNGYVGKPIDMELIFQVLEELHILARGIKHQ